jgi:DNA invertase Pin-like site-specific DNA recombinase
MANALVVQSVKLPASQKKFRAAQYVRMSTDKQRYSIENQAATIAAYAQLNDLLIVRTYRDEGESGLKLKNRVGLTQLLNDVSSNQADFGTILVYDVSRWGRFQDIDESAHYEFVCKQAGVQLVYCAEQFDNDGTMVSSIVKNIKRVMAAEYSRELSAKVFAGSCRFARMGFQLGGPAVYGLRRVVVDEKRETKGLLAQGDRKFLQTDHVRLQPGDDNEIAIVRWIFKRFLELKSEKAIALELNQRGVPAKRGVLWSGPLITRILKNEKYIGNVVYNRRSGKLQTRHTFNPPEMWIRSEGSIEAIVEADVFVSANKIIQERRIDLSEQQMLARLRQTLMKEGRLSAAIINKTIGLPCHKTYVERFGTIRKAYQLIGYVSERDCAHIDARQAWNDHLSTLASRVAAKVERTGGCVGATHPVGGIQINGTLNVFFRIARWHQENMQNHTVRWRVQRRRLPGGWIVVVRLGIGNESVLDYLLMPTAHTDADAIWLSENNLRRLKIVRFEDFDALVRSIVRRATNKRQPKIKRRR